MSYTIAVQVYQTNTNAFFHISEMFTNYPDSWERLDGVKFLSMNTNGTSGSLGFVADTGENFVCTLGVNDHRPWGDIVPQTGKTASSLHAEYYETEYGGTNNPIRVAVRRKNLIENEVSQDGRKYAFKYTATGGRSLKVNIIIG